MSACAGVPVAVTAGTIAVDGFSYAATGKGTADHLISGLTGEDCAMLRGFNDKPVCRPNTSTLLADAGTAPIATGVMVPVSAGMRTLPSAAQANPTPQPTIASIMRGHLRAFNMANGIKPAN